MLYKILNRKAKFGHILKKMCEISVALFLCSFKFSSQNLLLELKWLVNSYVDAKNKIKYVETSVGLYLICKTSLKPERIKLSGLE